MKLEELLEAYSIHRNRPIPQPRSADNPDDFMQYASVVIEKHKSECHRQLSRAIELESLLRFEAQNLQQECDQLTERLQTATQEHISNNIQREKAINEIIEQTNHIRSKCSMYEKALGAKFLSNDDSTTVFIFNPDGVIQHRMQRMPTEDTSLLNCTPPELKELNSLWAKMKISDDYMDLLDDPVEWRGKLNKKLKAGPATSRTVLTPLNNRN